MNPQEVQHLHDLEVKNERLKDEVRRMQLKAEKFDRRLYATGLIVRCSGGCLPGAPANYEDLTEERVVEVENIAARLRSWWTHNRKRIGK